MTRLMRCPACDASGAICSTCGGKRLVPVDAAYDWREFAETNTEARRIDRNMKGREGT